MPKTTAKPCPPRGPRLVVVGSSNTDLVLTLDRLPRPGETLGGGAFQRFGGGKGANQAVALARAGCAVAFVGARGDDDFGRQAAAGLAADGVDTTRFIVKPGLPSGVALIFLGGRERDNMIGVARSANHALTAADVQAAAPLLAESAGVLAQLEIPMPAVLAAARLARRHNRRFVLTPAPVPAHGLPAALYPLVDTLVPNAGEAMALAGRKNVEAAARELLRRGCRQVVVTLGARGAFWMTDGACGQVPAPKVRPVDTVGAGDCFAAWLAAGLADGLALSEAVAGAVRAAAVKVTRAGAQAGMPRPADLAGGAKLAVSRARR